MAIKWREIRRATTEILRIAYPATLVTLYVAQGILLGMAMVLPIGLRLHLPQWVAPSLLGVYLAEGVCALAWRYALRLEPRLARLAKGSGNAALTGGARFALPLVQIAKLVTGFSMTVYAAVLLTVTAISFVFCVSIALAWFVLAIVILLL